MAQRAQRIGVLLRPAGEPAGVLALARRAESLGLGIAAVAAPGGAPAALPLCAALAAATRRIAVASFGLPLAAHHPLRVAEDAATLDGISEGRFELGLDSGTAPGAPGAPEELAARFAEAVEILRQAWSAEPVDFAGRHFRCAGVEVHPKPARPGGPPLWASADSEAAMACAARLGLGLALRAGADPAPYLNAHAAARAAETRAGEAGVGGRGATHAAARESGALPGGGAAPRLAWIGAASEVAHALGHWAGRGAELEGWVEARHPADLEAAARLAAHPG